jgi:hypothetical protein
MQVVHRRQVGCLCPAVLRRDAGVRRLGIGVGSRIYSSLYSLDTSADASHGLSVGQQQKRGGTPWKGTERTERFAVGNGSSRCLCL